MNWAQDSWLIATFLTVLPAESARGHLVLKNQQPSEKTWLYLTGYVTSSLCSKIRLRLDDPYAVQLVAHLKTITHA